MTLWTVARQAPLSMGFSRQEYWSGLPCLPPGNLPNAGIEPASPVAPALQVDSSPLSHRGSLSRDICMPERKKWPTEDESDPSYHLTLKMKVILPITSHLSGWLLSKRITRVGEGVEKLEPVCSPGGRVKQCDCFQN